MKSLHNSNETPPNMAPTFINSGTYQTLSIMSGSSSGTTNDAFCIKHFVAIAGLNKLETQPMYPDVAELANVFHTMFNLN